MRGADRLSERTSQFDTIEEAIAAIKNGEMVIVVDDEDRENEGDLLMAAEKVTPEAINFMVRFGRGLVCMPLEGKRLDELDIPPMVTNSRDPMGTAFTVSIDAKATKTGISAHERALTIKTVIDPHTTSQDLVRPGHIFPLRAKEGGVLRRPGHTEAAVDLARLAGCCPAGVICEIMNEDGTMARLPQLRAFAAEHGLKLISIADLIRYRRQREKLVTKVAEASLPTVYGIFRALAYEEKLTGECHIALRKDKAANGLPPLVRVHSECLTGDVLGSMRCDCGQQLQRALQVIGEEGGVLLYMRQEGRGIGLGNKMRAYALQDEGKDTVEANECLGFPPDARDYGIGAQILADMGVRQMRLLTNNPRKFHGLEGYGLEIVDRVPLEIPPNPYNERYLATKREKLGHLLSEREAIDICKRKGGH
ncbi:MAG TPA: bifunctional 3,4-dihydroxy-2-butanone-4-phosphate synthase/GTP cyclohydrolase II [Firmicutes bacterium]|nr:bifunctional 3,4-dihydroxy-2-butanone-4-phosphate synthase/GTP cyclohydrolase II [Bacillota bacterium]